MTFSHRDAGTAEARWQDAGIADLPEAPGRPELTADTLLVVVAAHPDDETLGATGLIRSVLAAGGSVRILVCSAGERSQPDSPTHTAAELVALRRDELAAAVEALGAGHGDRLEVTGLGLPDGDLAGHTGQVQAAVTELLDRHGGPSLLATHYHRDGHTDHDALGRILAGVAEDRRLPLYEFPIWYWHWADPDRHSAWRHWGRWPLAAADRQRRLAALAAHASQGRPLSPAPGDEAILGPGMLEHFTGRAFDVYRYTDPDHAHAGRAREIFDRLYREHEDPWQYLGSWYEQRKRMVTLATLPRARYGTVVEAGSSIGVLTAGLAERAGRVIGLDASAVAVGRARERLADRPHVRVDEAVLPDEWPQDLLEEDPADLVVLSEIGYFLSAEELERLLDECERSLALSGQLVLCHWRHAVEGWPLDGDQVHRAVARDRRFRCLSVHRESDFAVEVYARVSAAERVAVVVPARNEQDLLPRTLRSLARAADRWEELHAQGSVAVVVALDRCTDASARVAADFAAEDPRFHVLDLSGGPGPAVGPGQTGAGARQLEPRSGIAEEGSVGRARDLGLRRAVELLGGGDGATGGGDLWVATTDADTVVPEDWLVAQTVLAARAEGPAVVAGTVALAPGEADEAIERRWRERYEHREGHPHVHGANLGLPWTVYASLGGFPHLQEHGDVALVAAAREAGVTVLATDRTRVVTSGRQDGRTPGGFAGYLRDLASDGG